MVTYVLECTDKSSVHIARKVFCSLSQIALGRIKSAAELGPRQQQEQQRQNIGILYVSYDSVPIASACSAN